MFSRCDLQEFCNFPVLFSSISWPRWIWLVQVSWKIRSTRRLLEQVREHESQKGMPLVGSLRRQNVRSDWTRNYKVCFYQQPYALTIRFSCWSYAMGGFDGETMVSSVEILDPRLGSWMMGEPLNVPRGYTAAAVLGDAIFVIGGLQTTSDIWDTVSCSI